MWVKSEEGFLIRVLLVLSQLGGSFNSLEELVVPPSMGKKKKQIETTITITDHLKTKHMPLGCNSDFPNAPVRWAPNSFI